jgi:hypothetical protein
MDKFHLLQKFNIGSVFSTLFDQSLAEAQLTHTLQSLIPIMKKNFDAAKQSLDMLFEVLSNDLICWYFSFLKLEIRNLQVVIRLIFLED